MRYGSLGILALVVLATPVAAAGLRVVSPRCEYLVDPQGVDVAAPRLSWLVESDERGQKQTAYQILVASSREKLAADQGDLWDTGKVASDETTGVAYAGKKLASHVPCFWKVRVWDKDGQASPYSAAAGWSMGLLSQDEWKAEWIGCDKFRVHNRPDADFGAAKWIWHTADPKMNAPKGSRLFLSSFTIPEGSAITKAELMVTADDSYRFVINTGQVSQSIPGGDGFRAANVIDVADRVKLGVNDVRVQVTNGAPGPAALIARITVHTADGKIYTHVTDASWKSTNKPGAFWHNREIDASSWPNAVVVGNHGDEPWGITKRDELFLPPVPYLRTEFTAAKPVARAVLYATALGIYDGYVNGRRVADDRFSPGWTDYTKRVYYRAFDVTADVKPGKNALGAVLSDGWYSGYIGWGHHRNHFGKKPRFRAQLHLFYADGTSDVIATGPQWKANIGPLSEADYLMGESYDARKELTGWNQPAFDDSRWEAVVAGCDEVKPLVQWHPGPPVLPFAEFQAKQVTEPKSGVYVLDLGQNFAGIVRLKVSGKPGQKIQLRFAERLNPDGTIYTINLRSARTTDTYVCRGQGVETWEPRFTFHGFQYVEVTGVDAKPSADAVVGVALSSATPVVGKFSSSDAMLNQLHNNIVFTQRANFIDLPTDCPQRDERLGWTGDAQVYVRTATLNTDVQAFFTKWLVDLEDGQRADGQFPMVAPVKVAGDDGGPAWADAGVICPWTIYQVYGDARLLAKHYNAMLKFIDFCQKRSTPELLPPKQYHCFGDWLSIKADTPKEVIYTAYSAYSPHLAATAADTLGKMDDAKRLHELFEKIKAAFNKAYVADDGRIKGNTQTCYVLAIAFDLVDGARRDAAAKYLVEDIESRDGCLSTGFIGTKDLMLALAKIGRNDVAYRLLHNDKFPSWGFSIKHGATSIWERWDGWTPEKGFQDPGMNSFAHYSFGAVYQWMVENIGGIRAEEVGYRRISITPQPDPKMEWAKITYNGPRGLIESGWKRAGAGWTFDICVPANTTAKIVLPVERSQVVVEGGKPLGQSIGLKEAGRSDTQLTLEAVSGKYQFSVSGR